MRAVVIREPGGPEVLEVREVEAPTPAPGQIAVRVVATALNRADLLQRQGHYPAPPGAPADIPGLEYAGEVSALGTGVRRWKVGDRVMGLVGGGAYAEQVVVHEDEAAPIPRELSFEQAAAVPEAFLTAYDAIVSRGRLDAGDALLVTAVASGVGTAALQIALTRGCRVVGTSRSADKLARCAELGLAHGVVPDAAGAFAAQVRAATAGRGVDVVLELVGGASLVESVASCAPRGRVVVVGLTAGASAALDLGALLRQRLELIGTVMRSRPLHEKIEVGQLLARRLVPLFEQGRLRPIVDRTFDLAQAPEAHRYLASNASLGKVVLRVAAG